MTGNRKSFIVSIKDRKSFNLVMSYFDYAITFLFNINLKINIDYVMSLFMKVTQTLIVKRVRILISKVKLITTITQTLNIKKLRLVLIFGKLLKITINPKQHIDIIAYSVLRQKIVSIVNMKKLKLVTSVILATFYPLSTYDPQTLLTLDTETLGEMDYVIA